MNELPPISWPQHLSRLHNASQALQRLDDASRYVSETTYYAWLEQSLIDEAVANVLMDGRSATRARVRLLEAGLEQSHAGDGEKEAQEILQGLKAIYGPRGIGISAESLWGSGLCSGRETLLATIGDDISEYGERLIESWTYQGKDIENAQKIALLRDLTQEETETIDNLRTYLKEVEVAAPDMPSPAVAGAWAAQHFFSNGESVVPENGGRLARILIPHALSFRERDRRKTPTPFFISIAFQEKITSWRPRDTFDVWLSRFLDAVITAASQHVSNLLTIERRQDDMLARIKKADLIPKRSTNKLLQAANFVALHEIVSPNKMATAIGCSHASAWRYLQKLEFANIVYECTGRESYQLYALANIQKQDLVSVETRRMKGALYRPQDHESAGPATYSSRAHDEPTAPLEPSESMGKWNMDSSGLDEAIANLNEVMKRTQMIIDQGTEPDGEGS